MPEYVAGITLLVYLQWITHREAQISSQFTRFTPLHHHGGYEVRTVHKLHVHNNENIITIFYSLFISLYPLHRFFHSFRLQQFFSSIRSCKWQRSDDDDQKIKWKKKNNNPRYPLRTRREVNKNENMESKSSGCFVRARATWRCHLSVWFGCSWKTYTKTKNKKKSYKTKTTNSNSSPIELRFEWQQKKRWERMGKIESREKEIEKA